jgi:hypothetical protein
VTRCVTGRVVGGSMSKLAVQPFVVLLPDAFIPGYSSTHFFHLVQQLLHLFFILFDLRRKIVDHFVQASDG